MRGLFFFIFLFFWPGVYATDRPDFGLVQHYNDKISIEENSYSEDIPKYDEGSIRNAWIKLFTVTPSVLDQNNKTWIDRQGRAYLGSGFIVEIPENDEGCGSTYTEGNSYAAITIKAGDVILGQVDGSARSYNYNILNDESNFNLSIGYDITSTYTEHIHSLHEYCDDYGCWSVCEKDSEKLHTDTLHISDSARYYLSDLAPEIFIRNDGKKINTYYGYFESTSEIPTDGFALDVSGSKLNISYYDYYVTSQKYIFKKYSEYEIIIYAYEAENKATVLDQKSILYMDPVLSDSFTSFFFSSPNEPTAADITVFSHVNNITISTYEVIDPLGANLTVEIPARVKPGESFDVGVLLEAKGQGLVGKEVSVTYGIESKTVTTDQQGKAAVTLQQNPDYKGIVTVVFWGDRDYKAASTLRTFIVSNYDFGKIKGLLVFVLIMLSMGYAIMYMENNSRKEKLSKWIGFVFVLTIVAYTYTTLLTAVVLVAVGYFIFLK